MTTGTIIPSELPPKVEARPSTAKEPAAGGNMLEHEYDGIKEYDNPLPGWWVKIFWGSFFFSIGYLFHYHVSGNGQSVAAAYDSEMALVRAEQARQAMGEKVNEEGLAKLVADGKTLEEGKAVFAQRCMPCHGDRAQGVIGPNLTDSHWIHGDTLMHIFESVSEGVPAKGMPAWKMQLTPAQLRQVTAFVGSVRGTNAPGGKAPEGTPIAPAVP